MATITKPTLAVPDRIGRSRPTGRAIVLGLFLAAHGVVHVLGFVVPWKLARIEGMPYHTTVLVGRADLGVFGIRVVGLLWLLAAIGFIVAGIKAMRLGGSSQGLIAAVSLFSLLLCVLNWPEAGAGAVVDVAILAVLAIAALVRLGHVT